MQRLFFKLFFIAIFFIAACKPVETTIPKGFDKINDSVFVQYFPNKQPHNSSKSDTLVIEKSITNEFDIEIPLKEKVSETETFTINQISTNTFLKLLQKKIHIGDSLIICTNAHSYFSSEKIHASIFLAPSQLIYIHLKAKQKQKQTNTIEDDLVTSEMDEDEAIDEEKIVEKPSTILDNKLLTNEIADYEKEEFTLQYFLEYSKPEMLKHKIENGYYLRIVKKGHGAYAKIGDKVTISYVGKFLDGKLFDDSSLYPDPIEFELGKPDQVLKGIEKAIYKLREGGEANVYFSSRFGYGAEGSVSGIVGKYKSLTFAVHLKKINKK